MRNRLNCYSISIAMEMSIYKLKYWHRFEGNAKLWIIWEKKKQQTNTNFWKYCSMSMVYNNLIIIIMDDDKWYRMRGCRERKTHCYFHCLSSWVMCDAWITRHTIFERSGWIWRCRYDIVYGQRSFWTNEHSQSIAIRMGISCFRFVYVASLIRSGDLIDDEKINLEIHRMKNMNAFCQSRMVMNAVTRAITMAIRVNRRTHRSLCIDCWMVGQVASFHI